MTQPQIYRDLKADHDKQRDMLKELGELGSGPIDVRGTI